jgi:hypothetical protein
VGALVAQRQLAGSCSWLQHPHSTARWVARGARAVWHWASDRMQLAWRGFVELGPQRHGARRGGSSQQLSAGCTSRPAPLLVTGDSECRREGGDCSSPEKPAASKLGLVGAEATRRRWSSSIEAARPVGRRLSAETRHCAE